MKKMFLAGLTIVAGALVIAATLHVGSEQAQARPAYNKAFQAKYPDLGAAKEAKCGVCHEGTDKKVRNDYGKAVGKALGAKNVKEDPAIMTALDAAAASPSGVEGKTFGDLIKEGKLPASK